MRNIEEVLNKNTKKELIDEIFNQVYKIDLVKYDKFESKSSNVDGYYISLSKLSKKDMSNTHVIFKMFYTIEKLAKRIFIGDINETDVESNKQFARMYLIEVLNKYLDSEFNDKVEDSLRIHSLDSFKDILRDDKLSSNVCNFIIKATENKLKNYIRKSNVDSYYDYKTNTFKKNSYIYLDADVETCEDSTNYHEIIADDNSVIDKEEKRNLYKYIYKNYIEDSNLLLRSQLEFFYFAAENARIDGKTIVCDGYSKQLIYKYKKNILKRIEKAIADDSNVGKIRDSEGNITKYFLK